MVDGALRGKNQYSQSRLYGKPGEIMPGNIARKYDVDYKSWRSGMVYLPNQHLALGKSCPYGQRSRIALSIWQKSDQGRGTDQKKKKSKVRGQIWGFVG